jgi:pSer/pThr/pTyr-binding forkhead associated (FHA) protein
MAKLVLSLDGNVITEYQLDKDVITIGRRPDNDIHIDNLSVSGYHAKVLTIFNDSFIEDLESANGTLISNQKITKQALVNNNSIVIGNHQLKYINTDTKEKNDFVETMVIRPSSAATKNSATTKKSTISILASSTTIPDTAKLRLMSGENKGKELPLTKILTTVGSPNIQVAAITRRPTGYFLIVVDAGKYNKMPMVNGIEIDKEHPLVDTDIIDVGGIKMAFFLN